MLPVEQGHGQIWLRDQFLCDVEYKISEPLPSVGNTQVQRIILVVPEEHCAILLDEYDLTLIMADGQPYPIPRPLQHLGLSQLECYIESSA